MILFLKIVIAIQVLYVLGYTYYGTREAVIVYKMRRAGLRWSEIAEILRVPRL